MALQFGPPLLAGAAPAIASYDYVDIAAGIGIINFYAGDTSGAVVLSNDKFYSSKTMTNYNGGASGAAILDVDFDAEFNLPRMMKGSTIINVPFGVQGEHTTQNFATHVLATVSKVSGGAETQLVSGASAVLTLTTTAGNVYKYAMGAIDVTIPLTHFKKGDSLRLNIKQFALTATENGNFFFGHDPMERVTSPFNDAVAYGGGVLTWGTAPSILTFQAPFRIDL